MAEPIRNILGIVGIKHRGAYDELTNYEKLNVVTYEGSSYCAKGNTVGNLPTDTEYWDLIAEKGDQGSEGPQGPQGIPGAPSGTPLVASSTSEMTDTTQIYVNLTDGDWYYYNGEQWLSGGPYLTDVNYDELENRIDKLTSGKKIDVDRSNSNHRYPTSGGTLGSLSDMQSYYFPIEPLKKYKVVIKGAHNRFFVTLCNSMGTGDPCNAIYTFYRGRAYDDYVFTNTDYKYLLLTYCYDNSNIDPEEVYIIEDDIDPFNVNAIPVITEENISDKLHINRKLYSIDDFLVNGYNSSASQGFKVDGNQNKSLVIMTKKNYYYDIELTGLFNRFTVFGYTKYSNDFVEIYRADSTYTEKKYSYYNTLYDYIVITVGINIASIDFSINGKIIEYEKADEIDIEGFNLKTYKNVIESYNYITKDNMSLITNVDTLYAAYDNLITLYPDYVSKTLLGQDESGINLYEYKFSTGNYNSIVGQRPHDSEIPKKKILVVTGIHGSEEQAVNSTYLFFKDLCSNYNLNRIKENYDIRVIPVVNAWGLNNDSRVNYNGVDLNRNFDANWVHITSNPTYYSGESPADQSETQIVQNWMDSNNDAVLYIDYHNSGYHNEVSYLGSKISEIKNIYLNSISNLNSYLINEENFSDSLIFEYVGYTGTNGSSVKYSEKKNLVGALLECSNNQNSTGSNSSETIRAGAMVLGNIILGFYDKNN